MPLHYAALSSSVQALKYVITTLGADPLARDTFGQNVVYYAALSHSDAVWTYVINTLKMDPSAKDNKGQMASYYQGCVPDSSPVVKIQIAMAESMQSPETVVGENTDSLYKIREIVKSMLAGVLVISGVGLTVYALITHTVGMVGAGVTYGFIIAGCLGGD
jgi:hypothetical protein